MGTASSDRDLPEATERELETLARAMPELANLLERQPGEPEHPSVFYASDRSKHGTYPMVHVPVYGRRGTLWVGRMPGVGSQDSLEEEIEALADFGIRHVVCLVPDDSMAILPAGAAAYPSRARERFKEGFRSVPIRDFGTPSRDEPFERALVQADQALRAGTPTLVHCLAGCGRTGMFVSCLLVRVGEAPRSAIRRFRHVRGCGPETVEQVAYVFRYARRLGQGQCG